MNIIINFIEWCAFAAAAGLLVCSAGLLVCFAVYLWEGWLDRRHSRKNPSYKVILYD